MKTMSIKLPDDLDVQLADAAHRKGVTKSNLIRDAVAAYLERTDQGSFAAQAGDLVGCVTGPTDLASNTEHLDGYGR